MGVAGACDREVKSGENGKVTPNLRRPWDAIFQTPNNRPARVSFPQGGTGRVSRLTFFDVFLLVMSFAASALRTTQQRAQAVCARVVPKRAYGGTCHAKNLPHNSRV